METMNATKTCWTCGVASEIYSGGECKECAKKTERAYLEKEGLVEGARAVGRISAGVVHVLLAKSVISNGFKTRRWLPACQRNNYNAHSYGFKVNEAVTCKRCAGY
ncbi:MAG TPA: hypothetical protein DEH78_23375 [Solibacterales bacterium]|nr:hypothetical protein [Bryobacterales bacterium]